MCYVLLFVHAFQNILDSSKRKPNKIWTDQGSEFYNTPFKKWYKDNSIELYSTHNEGKSVFRSVEMLLINCKIHFAKLE